MTTRRGTDGTHPRRKTTPDQLSLEDWHETLAAPSSAAKQPSPDRGETAVDARRHQIGAGASRDPGRAAHANAPARARARTSCGRRRLPRLPVVALPGYSRPMIRAEEYLELVARSTYNGTAYDRDSAPMSASWLASGCAGRWLAHGRRRASAPGRAYRVGTVGGARVPLRRLVHDQARGDDPRRLDRSASSRRCASPTSSVLAEPIARADAARGGGAVAGESRRRRREHAAAASQRRRAIAPAAHRRAARRLDHGGRRRRPGRRAHCEGRRRETVRKMPARARDDPRPRGRHTEPGARQDHGQAAAEQDRPEIVPPTAEHVLAVHDLLPTRYRLPLLVLDATGHAARRARAAHVGRRRRATAALARLAGRLEDRTSPLGRTSRPSSSTPSCALVPRDDRIPDRRVFQGFGGDRFRTAVTRACTAAGVPAFSPHDLRHRRISPPPPRRRPVGADRRARRPAEPRRHREHVQPRARRRGRARLRRAARRRVTTVPAQSPSTSARAASRSRSSLALRRPTDSPSLSGLTAVVCSTSTRVGEPSSSIVGRNDRGGAAVDVGETSTVESASSSSAWTTTA